MWARVVWLLLMAGMLWLPVSTVAQEPDPTVTIHVVQRGENLYRIALQYGLTVQELANLNGITDPSSIQVGQRLLVPASEAATNLPEFHTVQPGETIQSIADTYGITAEELAAVNNIMDIDSIYVGQVLNLSKRNMPISSEVSLVTDQPTTQTQIIHTVQSGETLFRIATNYGVTVNDVARANNLTDPTLIYAGQQLIVPGVEPPQLALDLPSSITSLEISPLIFVEGQTGRVQLKTVVPVTVSGTFLGNNFSVASEEGNFVHTILLGIPIFTEASIYPLSLSVFEEAGAKTDLTFNIQILSGNYGSESITLLSDRSNLLDPNMESDEQSLVASVMNPFTLTRYWGGVMGLPVAAPVISPFGRRRSFDGGPFDHFHSGTDFGGAPGAPILASASGYVVFAGILSVRGVATIIDHGWGVYTGYWHQADQYVQVGDFVTTGQIIGSVGSTGRVTGPHLHWELWVGGVPVDPMQWVRQAFS